MTQVETDMHNMTQQPQSNTIVVTPTQYTVLGWPIQGKEDLPCLVAPIEASSTKLAKEMMYEVISSGSLVSKTAALNWYTWTLAEGVWFSN
jgi:hypothetical protein